MISHPELHTAPLGYGNNGPLTWVAECRVPRVPPSKIRLEMAAWMIENGSDVHQGGDGPLMRAALDDQRIDMMRLLVAHGANVNAKWNGNYPIICAPCETLAPDTLRWLLKHGADPNLISEKYGSPLAIVVATYSRNAVGKHQCIEVFRLAGFELPDTPPMALAAGRLDRLAELLQADPEMLSRKFSYAEIFPPSIGIKQEEGLTSTPLDGTTLLHQAVEFEDVAMVEWLMRHGADPNARAVVDAEGFGGHVPLHHAVISMGNRTRSCAALLLLKHADPSVRATFRKQLGSMGDQEKERMYEFHDVTPAMYAQQYQEPAWINGAAMAAIEENLTVRHNHNNR